MDPHLRDSPTTFPSFIHINFVETFHLQVLGLWSDLITLAKSKRPVCRPFHVFIIANFAGYKIIMSLRTRSTHTTENSTNESVLGYMLYHMSYITSISISNPYSYTIKLAHLAVCT